jgi:hypothetical protein
VPAKVNRRGYNDRIGESEEESHDVLFAKGIAKLAIVLGFAAQ